MKELLPYSPGCLPKKKAPETGESIKFQVDGHPPVKKKSRSLRNPNNPHYNDFVRLREAAIKAMNGRAWYFGPIKLIVDIHIPKDEILSISLNDYVGGIEDTLDGSSGVHFTYLPIVYEDDSQICDNCYRKTEDNKWYYTINVIFL